MFKKRLKLLLVISIVLAIFLVGCGGNKNDDADTTGVKKPDTLTIVSAPAGGVWNAVAAGLSDILGKEGVRIAVEPGGGVSNVISCSEGDAELGLTASIIPTLAREGKSPFKEVADNVAGVSVLFDNTVHVVVDKDIKSIEELKGEKFSSQPLGQATQVAFEDLLRAHGMSEDDLSMERGSQQEAVQLLQDGHVKGMTAVTGHPSGAILELATAKDVNFLGANADILAKMQEINPGYVAEVMPANTYPNQTTDVETVGTPTILIVNADVSDDDVYWITKTLAEKIKDVNDMHNATSDLTVEKMAEIESIMPIHPGAKRYYDEVLK